MTRVSIPLDDYDFGDLGAGATQRFVLKRSIPAPYSRGTLAVRVHALDVGSGSDGDITVSVRADGFTRDDPAELFFGDTLASIVAATDGDAAPRYLVDTFALAADHLMIQIEGTQDASSALALSARVSVELLMDDGPLDDWTPAALSPDGWWRADLGHALSDSDPVTSWANQGTAGSDGDVGQGTSALQPAYVESHASFNGQAVIDFDGGDVLYAAAGPWWQQTVDGESLSVIAVGRVTLGTANQNHLATTRQAPTVGGFHLTSNTGGAGRWYVYDQGNAANLVQTYFGNVQNAVETIAALLEGVVSPAADTRSLWLDGVFINASSGDLGVIAASSPRELTIGGNAPTMGTYVGQIAEVLYLKRLLSASEDAALTRYLEARYGLSLPGVTR